MIYQITAYDPMGHRFPGLLLVSRSIVDGNMERILNQPNVSMVMASPFYGLKPVPQPVQLCPLTLIRIKPDSELPGILKKQAE